MHKWIISFQQESIENVLKWIYRSQLYFINWLYCRNSIFSIVVFLLKKIEKPYRYYSPNCLVLPKAKMTCWTFFLPLLSISFCLCLSVKMGRQWRQTDYQFNIDISSNLFTLFHKFVIANHCLNCVGWWTWTTLKGKFQFCGIVPTKRVALIV